MKNKIIILLICLFSQQLMAQNVGIGTNTPIYKLTVKAPGTGITHTDGTTTLATYLDANSGQIGTISNHRLGFYTNNGSEQMTLLPNGNLGIGTTNPQYPLTINTPSTGLGFLHTNGVISLGTELNSGIAYFGTRTNHALSFQTNNNRKMIISPNGRIGMGTYIVNPQTFLHIDPNGAGSILLGADKSAGSNTTLEMGISALQNGYSYIQSTKASGSSWGNLSLNPNGGRVFINSPTDFTSDFPLDIQEDNSGFGIRLRYSVGGPKYWDMSATGSLYFNYNGSFKAYISSIDGSYVSSSDARFKTNVNNLETVMDKVMQLKAKSYEFKAGNPTHKISTGFIAQEVLPLFPELVSIFDRPAKDSTATEPYMGLNYAGFGVIAIKAIQEQQAQIDALQKDVEALKQLLKGSSMKNR